MLSELSAAPPPPGASLPLAGCGPSSMISPSSAHSQSAHVRASVDQLQLIACSNPGTSALPSQQHQRQLQSQGLHAQQQQSAPQFPLSALPNELVCLVLKSTALTSRDLAKVCVACKQLRNLAHIAADDKLSLCLQNNAREVRRWRYPSLNRLLIEETLSGFSWDAETQDPADFMLEATQTGTHIRLDGPGPKMLVSKDSTSSSKLLRWKFKLEGNNAVEFGVVPECLQHDSKALHKCYACKCKDAQASAAASASASTAPAPAPAHARRQAAAMQVLSPAQVLNAQGSPGASGSSTGTSAATGFCSTITVGSNLPVKMPLMKGSDIEILVWNGPEMDASKPKRMEFIIKQPEKNAIEMVWQNQSTMPKPYKGPQHLRFELELAGDESYKLALTCWAKAHLISAAPPAWQ